MKQILQALRAPLLAFFASLVLLAGCSPSTVDFRNAEIVNGKLYKSGANDPYSGRMTNVPQQNFLVGNTQQGFTTLVKTAMAAYSGSEMDRLLLVASLCDLTVRDGLIEGKVTCMVPQSQTKRFEATFEKSTLHGPFFWYDVVDGNQIAIKAKFSHGKLDGEHEMFGLKTHRIVRRIHWEEGVPVDEEEQFNEESGKKTMGIPYKDGKIQGLVTGYAPDGKTVVYRASYVAGAPEGVEEKFDPQTGQRILQAQWSGGKLNGKTLSWDAQGKALKDTYYKDGFETLPPASAPSEANAVSGDCAEAWTAAFRKEQGEDAIVTVDQLGEWRAWCDSGKRPG